MRKSSPLLVLCALALALCAPARAAESGHVLPGAFGEAIDTLDAQARALVTQYADLALQSLLDACSRGPDDPDAGPLSRICYLQIVQTTVYLIGDEPKNAGAVQRRIWQDYYKDVACVVSFSAIDDALNYGDVPYAGFSGLIGEYAVRSDGTVEDFSLKNIRARMFEDPIIPGTRVINLGDSYNAVYTFSVVEGGVPLFWFLDDLTVSWFVDNIKTNFPVSVSVRHDGEGSGEPVTSTDPATIQAVFDALCNISVLEENVKNGHTDDYLNYYFTLADGTVISGFEFQDGMLLDAWMGLYEITGFDALQRALPDPGL